MGFPFRKRIQLTKLDKVIYCCLSLLALPAQVYRISPILFHQQKSIVFPLTYNAIIINEIPYRFGFISGLFCSVDVCLFHMLLPKCFNLGFLHTG